MATKDKSYRLTNDRSGETFTLQVGRSGRMTIFDPKANDGNGARRAIRHCPNQKSIFIDEQDKHALVEPVIFINGYLDVSGKDPITQEFLDKHPSNVSNGGVWFEEVNDEMEAKESIVDTELEMDVKYAIRQMAKKEDGIHHLKAEVAVLLGSVEETYDKGLEELKQILYNEVENDPHYFADEEGNVTIFENGDIQRRYLTLTAIREGIIKKSSNGKSMLWAKDNKLIATAPASVDIVEHFANYLTTDDGILVAEEIARRS